MNGRPLAAAALALSIVVVAQTLQEPPNVFTPETPASAREVTENFEALDAGVATVRDLVIDVRREQIGLRDRLAAIERFVLDPPAAPTPALAALPDLNRLQDDGEEPIVFQAGAVANANDVNTRFDRLARDLGNIRDFVELLQRDLESMFDRLAVLEDLQLPGGAEVGAPDALAPVDATLPHAFTPQSTMRAAEVNANFDQLAAAVSVNDANAQGLASALDDFERRVTALEAAVGSLLCADLRPERSTRVFDIDVTPASPASLSTIDRVTATFDYVTNALDLGYDAFRIWFMPYLDGDFAPGGSFQGSVAITEASGTLSRFFSSAELEPGATTVVDEGFIMMSGVKFDDEGVQIAEVPILECVVPVDITFTQPE